MKGHKPGRSAGWGSCSAAAAAVKFPPRPVEHINAEALLARMRRTRLALRARLLGRAS